DANGRPVATYAATDAAPSWAEALGRATGSVSATSTVTRREADGSLVEVSREEWTAGGPAERAARLAVEEAQRAEEVLRDAERDARDEGAQAADLRAQAERIEKA